MHYSELNLAFIRKNNVHNVDERWDRGVTNVHVDIGKGVSEMSTSVHVRGGRGKKQTKLCPRGY